MPADPRDANPSMLMDDLRRLLNRLERAEEGLAAATAMIDDSSRMLDDAGVPDMRPDGDDAYTLIERVRFLAETVAQLRSRGGEPPAPDDVSDAWMAYMQHAGDLGEWPDTLAGAVERLAKERDAAMNRSAAAVQIARAMLAEAIDYADALESEAGQTPSPYRARLGVWRARLSQPLHLQAGRLDTDG